MKIFKLAGTIPVLALAGVFGPSAGAQAGVLTPDIIWGTGNTNRGFTVETDGTLELGLRAKQRYPSPNDALGVGIVQDPSGNYLFTSGGQPANRSVFNFDWGINTNVDGNGANLGSSGYGFQIDVDTDPTVLTNFSIMYDPFGANGTGYYVGNNSTPTNQKQFDSNVALTDLLFPGFKETDTFLDNLGNSNVAQNSVNMGFLTGGPLGSGQFTVRLSAFDLGSQELVSSVSINAIVDSPAPIPLPAAGWLLLTAFGGLGLAARRRRKAA